MSQVKMLRRKSDGAILEGVCYGTPKGHWTHDAMTHIAAFVLGIDPDVSTTALNERMLDVVEPVANNWEPRRGKADILVSTSQGVREQMGLGDWILKRPDEQFMFVTPQGIQYSYDFINDPRSPHEQAQDELTKFIYNECFGVLEGQLYETLAKTTAIKLLNAGWRNDS